MLEDLHTRLADPEYDVPDDAVLVLRNCGPRGYPGMPEVANMPLPKKVLSRGIRDMVRISDARMSGSAFGTVVLHVSPEAAAGGPLSIVQAGDMIALNVDNRRLDLLITAEEFASRVASRTTADKPGEAWGYEALYKKSVNDASEGADFQFLGGPPDPSVPRDNH